MAAACPRPDSYCGRVRVSGSDAEPFASAPFRAVGIRAFLALRPALPIEGWQVCRKANGLARRLPRQAAGWPGGWAAVIGAGSLEAWPVQPLSVVFLSGHRLDASEVLALDPDHGDGHEERE